MKMTPFWESFFYEIFDPQNIFSGQDTQQGEVAAQQTQIGDDPPGRRWYKGRNLQGYCSCSEHAYAGGYRNADLCG